jgi:hypothetical protein
MSKLTLALAVVVSTSAAFFAGLSLARPEVLAAQDRGPVRPQPSKPKEKETTTAPPLVYGESSGSSAAGNGLIAVTGSYGVGTSVLYVIDTQTRQMAVYEARGGSPDASRLFMVGARRIDLDLQLEGYNDLSEYDYPSLRRKFEDRDKPDASSAVDNPIPVRRR